MNCCTRDDGICYYYFLFVFFLFLFLELLVVYWKKKEEVIPVRSSKRVGLMKCGRFLFIISKLCFKENNQN